MVECHSQITSHTTVFFFLIIFLLQNASLQIDVVPTTIVPVLVVYVVLFLLSSGVGSMSTHGLPIFLIIQKKKCL